MPPLFTGHWLSTYTYHNGETGRHVLTFSAQNANEWLCKSVPQPDGSEVVLKLHYDKESSTLTGTWTEKTSPTGAYKGKVFHGVLQLIVNQDYTKAAGEWVGFNSGHTGVNAGSWKLERQAG